ncbi:Transcription factor tau subunit sfc1 [Pleurostoma richardsiae]|uniref:Transcription factor tau subunit sfc1 n=1 Tax=Pleurostoma richardsiae TaxID=41990 RepID=A0AA38VQC9_9PEZI|nr:Transcription factor tau subunit sfc1 [Pleurostoma richardsiae]
MSSQDVRLPSNKADAPIYTIPARTIAALEHPLTILDVDKGIKTLGHHPSFQSILDPNTPDSSIPLYLHYDSPTDRPLMSHYAASNNVVLKITVPKRTGRKRKRGSDEPFQGDVQMTGSGVEDVESEGVLSRSQLDDAKVLQRKLQDNVGRYKVEPVGMIRHTHRYRGLADFQYSLKSSDFMNRFNEKVMHGDVSRFREFSLNTGTSKPPNVELIPPPAFTPMTMPFHYSYSQNPYVRAVKGPAGHERVVNVTARVKSAGYFIQARDPIPAAPKKPPDLRDPTFAAVMKELEVAMEERPIWTRRSIINRLGTAVSAKQLGGGTSKDISSQMIRHGIQYVGYQFKGGPWRDALIKYGVDPRTDPKYRKYQTLVFRLRLADVGKVGRSWQDVRKADIYMIKKKIDENTVESHIFDGKSFADDGKVWQVCDITDPLLAKLLSEAAYRPTCDVDNAGWYHRGLYAKAKAIMKCKIRGIQFNREIKDADFDAALRMRDETPEQESKSLSFPMPDLKLTAEEKKLLDIRKYRGLGRNRNNKRTTYAIPLGRRGGAGNDSQTPDTGLGTVDSPSKQLQDDMMLEGAGDEDEGGDVLDGADEEGDVEDDDSEIGDEDDDEGELEEDVDEGDIDEDEIEEEGIEEQEVGEEDAEEEDIDGDEDDDDEEDDEEDGGGVDGEDDRRWKYEDQRGFQDEFGLANEPEEGFSSAEEDGE